MILPTPPLLVITDRHLAHRQLVDVARGIFEAGGRWLMIREKDLAHTELVALASPIVNLAAAYGATVAINGDAEAVVEAGAGGVHLPAGRSIAEARRTVGPDRLVGISAHRLDEVAKAAAEGADYVIFGPVFESISKPGYGPGTGTAPLGQAVAAGDVPVIALGGITAANGAACLAAGAAGLAVIGSVMAAADPAEAVRALIAAMDR